MQITPFLGVRTYSPNTLLHPASSSKKYAGNFETPAAQEKIGETNTVELVFVMTGEDAPHVTIQKLSDKRKVTPGQIGIVLAVCVIPIHLWSIYNTLRELPGWLMRMNLWDALGAIAYTQVFALLESLILWATLVLIAFILPRCWFADRFVAQASFMVAVFSTWVLVRHYLYPSYLTSIEPAGPLIIAAVLFSFLVSWFMIYRSSRINTTLTSVASRLAVLGFVYLALDLVSVLIILIRMAN